MITFFRIRSTVLKYNRPEYSIIRLQACQSMQSYGQGQSSNEGQNYNAMVSNYLGGIDSDIGLLKGKRR